MHADVVFMLETIYGMVAVLLLLGWLLDRKPYLPAYPPQVQCAHCRRYLRHPDDLKWEDDVPVCADTTECHGPDEHTKEAA